MGIGGVATFKNSDLQRVIKNIPLENIVIETDSPYLAPVPKRGKRNEPAYIVYVAQTIAKVFNLPVNEVACRTTENARNLFRI
jgi:TatD DNase family protein